MRLTVVCKYLSVSCPGLGGHHDVALMSGKQIDVLLLIYVTKISIGLSLKCFSIASEDYDRPHHFFCHSNCLRHR